MDGPNHQTELEGDRAAEVAPDAHADERRLSELYFFGLPGLYSVSSDAGGGRTLPVAAAMRSGSWFGGVALALQQVDASRQSISGTPVPVFDDIGSVPPPGGSLSARSHGNQRPADEVSVHRPTR
ncbi:MAG: hypothetical protein HY701_05380 [Gemmatimonadetes bacterium]|nr:hypothetical protein [Gemmatimonadota bacterium]